MQQLGEAVLLPRVDAVSGCAVRCRQPVRHESFGARHSTDEIEAAARMYASTSHTRREPVHDCKGTCEWQRVEQCKYKSGMYGRTPTGAVTAEGERPYK